MYNLIRKVQQIQKAKKRRIIQYTNPKKGKKIMKKSKPLVLNLNYIRINYLTYTLYLIFVGTKFEIYK